MVCWEKKTRNVFSYHFIDLRTELGSLMKVIVSRSTHLIEDGRNKLMLDDSDCWIKLNQRQSNTISVALLQGERSCKRAHSEQMNVCGHLSTSAL